MKRKSSKENKVAFINFLITNYNFKGDNEGIKGLLTFFKESNVLGRTEFVSGRNTDENTLIITAKETDSQYDFKFFADYGSATANIPSILKYVKTNYDERYEIIVNFNGLNAPEYRAVIDGGPGEVDEILAELQKKIEIEQIKKDIDNSLAEMNKDKFMNLTSKLKQIIG